MGIEERGMGIGNWGMRNVERELVSEGLGNEGWEMGIGAMAVDRGPSACSLYLRSASFDNHRA